MIWGYHYFRKHPYISYHYCKTQLTFHQPSIWQTPHCDTASRGGRASGRVAHKVPWTWSVDVASVSSSGKKLISKGNLKIIIPLSSREVGKLAQISHSAIAHPKDEGYISRFFYHKNQLYISTMGPPNLPFLEVFMVNNLVYEGGQNLYFSWLWSWRKSSQVLRI